MTPQRMYPGLRRRMFLNNLRHPIQACKRWRDRRKETELYLQLSQEMRDILEGEYNKQILDGKGTEPPRSIVPEDPYDLHVRICDNGKMSDGTPCTGSAHRAGKHLKCTDPSHVVAIEDGTYKFDTDQIKPIFIYNERPQTYGHDEKDTE